jgi:hypothetical protein
MNNARSARIFIHEKRDFCGDGAVTTGKSSLKMESREYLQWI